MLCALVKLLRTSQAIIMKPSTWESECEQIYNTTEHIMYFVINAVSMFSPHLSKTNIRKQYIYFCFSAVGNFAC